MINAKKRAIFSVIIAEKVFSINKFMKSIYNLVNN